MFRPGSVQQVRRFGVMVSGTAVFRSLGLGLGFAVPRHFGCLQRAQPSLVLPGADGNRWPGAKGDSLRSHNGHPEAQQPEQCHQVLRQQQVRSAAAFSVCLCSAGRVCVCVQCNHRTRAGVYLPRRSIPGQRLRNQAHAEARYLHRRDSQLPNRSGHHKHSFPGVLSSPRIIPLISNDRRRCSIQRCHHRDRRSDQRCAERRKGSPRHCRHCRILLWQPARTRSAGINGGFSSLSR